MDPRRKGVFIKQQLTYITRLRSVITLIRNMQGFDIDEQYVWQLKWPFVTQLTLKHPAYKLSNPVS